MRTSHISALLGKTVESAIATDDSIRFKTTAGAVYLMHHNQNCCEHVYVESIVGDLQDLIGSPITLAEEVSNADVPPPEHESDYSYTWTFYKLATVKGYVDIRWFGSSNGYYSESVDFDLVRGGGQ